ncbi:MAG: nitroreductase family protein [Deltaproteobacteria bacterium]
MNLTNDFLQFARSRRSIRKFRKDPLPREALQRMIEAASWAPSASNRQDWEFTAITSPPMKKRMEDIVRRCWKLILDKSQTGAIQEELQKYAKNFDWFSCAPVLLIVSAKRPEAFLSDLLGQSAEDVAGTEISAAMAVQNLMLAAHAMGIGSCCITGPLAAQKALKELLGLGQRRKIVCLVALGYPAEEPEAPLRKPVEKIVRCIDESG